MIRNTLVLFVLLCVALTAHTQTDKKTYFVYLNTNPDREKLEKEVVEKLQNAHLANIDSLYETGDLMAAGPFNDGGGIFIMYANDEDQLLSTIKTDPAIAAGRYNIEFFEFELTSGNFCQYRDPVEMLSYKYLRFKPNKQSGEHESQSLEYAIKGYMKSPYTKQAVLFSGSFNDNGGVVVLRSTYQGDLIEFIENHPYIEHGEHRCSQRELWLARGTFCD
jgi:uncharacterized protein YciI